MKNALKLTALFLLVTLSFTSCNKSDDNDGSTTSGNIVGKWNFSKEGGIVNGQEVLGDYQHQTGCAKDNVEFKSNGSVVSTEYSTNCAASTFTASYAKSGDTVTVTTSGDSTVLTILQLDSTTLKVKYTDTFEGTTTTYVELYTKG